MGGAQFAARETAERPVELMAASSSANLPSAASPRSPHQRTDAVFVGEAPDAIDFNREG